MKNFCLTIISLLISCCAYAQDPLNILKNSPFKNTFNSGDVQKAIEDLSNVWKVENDRVSFIITVEDLSLSASEILAYSKEYLEEAYRPSKYEIENLNTEKSFIVGKGEFNNFETYAAYPNQYSFNCEHHIRIDAKEGRARLCFSVKEYEYIRTNGNKGERVKVKVNEVSPADPNADSSRKMYNKVFLSMAKLAMGTLYDIQNTLKSKCSSDIGDW